MRATLLNFKFTKIIKNKLTAVLTLAVCLTFSLPHYTWAEGIEALTAAITSGQSLTAAQIAQIQALDAKELEKLFDATNPQKRGDPTLKAVIKKDQNPLDRGIQALQTQTSRAEILRQMGQKGEKISKRAKLVKSSMKAINSLLIAGALSAYSTRGSTGTSLGTKIRNEMGSESQFTTQQKKLKSFQDFGKNFDSHLASSETHSIVTGGTESNLRKRGTANTSAALTTLPDPDAKIQRGKSNKHP